MDSINDIINSLSSDDIKMLQGVASSILGDQNNSNSNNNTNDNKSSQSSENNNQNGNTKLPNFESIGNAISGLGLSQDDFGMMMKAKSIFDKMNNADSKNADLILALKPHLSPESRDKADQAIKILKLFEVLPYLKDMF